MQGGKKLQHRSYTVIHQVATYLPENQQSQGNKSKIMSACCAICNKHQFVLYVYTRKSNIR